MRKPLMSALEAVRAMVAAVPVLLVLMLAQGCATGVESYDGVELPSESDGLGGLEPSTYWYNGHGFVGQCVPPVREYFESRYPGLKIPYLGASGGAYLLASVKIPTGMTRVAAIQADDLIVWGPWPGNKYGHVAVAVGGDEVVDSNWVAPASGGRHHFDPRDPRITAVWRPNQNLSQASQAGPTAGSATGATTRVLKVTVVNGKKAPYIDFSYGYCPATSSPQACMDWHQSAATVVDGDRIEFSLPVQGGAFRFNATLEVGAKWLCTGGNLTAQVIATLSGADVSWAVHPVSFGSGCSAGIDLNAL